MVDFFGVDATARHACYVVEPRDSHKVLGTKILETACMHQKACPQVVECVARDVTLLKLRTDGGDGWLLTSSGSYVSGCEESSLQPLGDLSVDLTGLPYVPLSASIPNHLDASDYEPCPSNRGPGCCIECLDLEWSGHACCVERCRRIIIDEISKFSPEMVCYVDISLRQVAEIDKPLGGLMVLMVADFGQLALVKAITLLTVSKMHLLARFIPVRTEVLT
jgi:hypothetical protein